MPNDLLDRVCLITGASGGIGRAVAFAMAKSGARLCLTARNSQRLSHVAEEIRGICNRDPLSISADMTREDDLVTLADSIRKKYGGVNLFVNCAGAYARATVAEATLADFDELYATNLRGPYRLAQHLLPIMDEGDGDLVFVSSTQGLSANGSEIGQYASTHHGLRAIADSLRQEINGSGIRVTLLHAGTTASPMQERIHLSLGRTYCPDRLLQPEDIGEMIIAAVALARTAEVTELTIRSMMKP